MATTLAVMRVLGTLLCLANVAVAGYAVSLVRWQPGLAAAVGQRSSN